MPITAQTDSSTACTQVPKVTFFTGVKAGVPIAVGYAPIAMAFGLLAKSSGVPNEVSILMSLVVFAGASQFVGVNLLVLGTACWEIVLATFILNLRHFLMSAALSQRVERSITKPWLAAISFGITDETFTVASLRPEERLSKEFLLGLNLTAFAAWNIGTWIGLFLAQGLPEAVKASMGIALYAMFVGLLIPSVKKSRPALVIALVTMLAHGIMRVLPVTAELSTGWSIILATVGGALAGAIVYGEEGGGG
ncbi:MAG: AzlC family ABC transporter permease [Negativicutes bacterium]|nr:AzlC family ABC transporter permease [Negativicutes bacterium]